MEVPPTDWWWRAWTFWTRDPASIRDFFVILGGLAGFGLLWWRTWNIHRQTHTLMHRHESQTEADRERRITDNFTRAAELLGSDKLETRLGAIYALERIAQESRLDHWPIVETLTAYVRERAPWPPITMEEALSPSMRMMEQISEVPAKKLEPATDVQASLTVVARRCRGLDPAGQRLNLAETDLRGCELNDAHLEQAVLWAAHLEHAALINAHLEGAWLSNAHLEMALLKRAHLDGAWLEGAHLEGADLRDTDLTQEQFDSAISDEHTEIPPHINRRAQPDKPVSEDAAEARHKVTATPASAPS